MSRPVCIAIDWGTTSCRGYLMGADGTILNQYDSQSGILQVASETYATQLTELSEQLCVDWEVTPADVTTIAAGMITSRQGWVETGYLPCPVTLAALARNLHWHRIDNEREIAFVAGAHHTDADGSNDVMRGEEVQIFGALAESGPGLYILPGTHSKWAKVGADCLEAFATFMTGEVFAVLGEHSILGRLMENTQWSEAAFCDGVRAGFDASLETGGLLHRLFQVRTRGLFEQTPPSALSDYLSGLLVGHEIAGGSRQLASAAGQRIGLIGRGELVRRYTLALKWCGFETFTAPEHCAAKGLFAIAQQSGIVSSAQS